MSRIKAALLGGRGRFVSGLVIGMFVAGGVAVAAIPSTSTGKITACYTTSGTNKGLLRVIDTDANEKCKTGEKQLVWASSGLRFRGAWNALTNYAIDDVVVRNGSSYIAIATSKNVQPPNAGKWALMAARGADGADGTDGVDGEDATMVVADQFCNAPYRVVGYDTDGTIVCDEPTDADSDTFLVDLWNTDPSITSEDCDDNDDTIYPGATEVPNDGIDQDCDGNDLQINCDDSDPYTADSYGDGGCMYVPQDADVDGDGSYADTAMGGYPDCDDTNSSINPAAYDEPGDGIDQDCDGMDASINCDDSDPYTADSYENGGCVSVPQDADVDGDGSYADTAMGGYPDCDDTDSNIYPGAYDEPGDGIDQDCDGIDAS